MANLTSSSSSPRCVPFGFRRGGGRRTRGLPPPAAGAHAGGPAGAGCGRPLCRAAELVGGGIRGAFFASLETCSCVDVRTEHDDSFRMPDDPPEAAPLIMRHRGAGDGDSAAAAVAGGRSRRRRASGSSKQRRGGLGCCDTNSTSAVN